MHPANVTSRTSTTFRTSRVFPHRPEIVFDAFARADLLARWWGPAGFTNTFQIFEFEKGGRWRFVMHGPNGSNYPNQSTFREVSRPSRVVIQHVSPPRFVLTVSLTPVEAGTRIDWTQEFESEEVAARLKHVAEVANEQNLDRLGSVLRDSDPERSNDHDRPQP